MKPSKFVATFYLGLPAHPYSTFDINRLSEIRMGLLRFVPTNFQLRTSITGELVERENKKVEYVRKIYLIIFNIKVP